ncbi:hypothetical protein [Brevundimonas sp. Root1279]|uniref:hypothetical protein n=1 Tax=Brevundimonas sp. Root1279 TaxID=1736443 RepID=UPI000A58D282|nr:hypothetical protein [Brevundimonas sp. Root1279]
MDDSEAITPQPDSGSPNTATPARSAATERAQRLASALRDNLKRRKAASRIARPVKPSN